MAACIEAHDIPGNIAAPRLRVTRTYEISAPVACHHCEDAPCAKACPTGALFFDPKNHRIGVNEDNCIGCKSCLKCGCPALSPVHGEKKVHIDRDMCVGCTVCAQICPVNAISMEER